MKQNYRSKRWLSQGLESLVAEATESGDKLILDRAIVIIGSGYGGAVAAAELSGRGKAVTVLERGEEYLPGSFPDRMAEVPTHLRTSGMGAVGSNSGLFDFHLGGDVSTVVANGLGGGSLINAGVMLRPEPSVFGAAWPTALRKPETLADYFDEAETLLGAKENGQANNITQHAGYQQHGLKKHAAMKALGEQSDIPFESAPITVAMQDGENSAGVKLNACTLCGDCASGCNYGAKDSLDSNLLVMARRAGAELVTGASVLTVRRQEDSADRPWQIEVEHSQVKLQSRQGKKLLINAEKIIIAAGTLGSTTLLQRSVQAQPRLNLSPLLGSRFSTNGDMVLANYDQSTETNSIAQENQPPRERQVGPTITAMLKVPAGEGSPAICIEEMAVPGPLQWLFEEALTTTNSLYALGESDKSSHREGHPEKDPSHVDTAALNKTLLIAAMGDDGAAGRIETDDEGKISIHWNDLRHHSLFKFQRQKFTDMARNIDEDGRIIANPIWEILPPSLEYLVDNEKGPLLTVHPLGGCPMGDSPHQGVVDDCGRVYQFPKDTGISAIHDGLTVLDGSIIPTALATNPALTITALSLRAVRQLRLDWGMPEATTATDQRFAAGVARPVIADRETEIVDRNLARKKTVGRFIERLAGPIQLRGRDGKTRRFIAELTLSYRDKALQELFRPSRDGQPASPILEIEAQDSWLRIYSADPEQKNNWEKIRTEADASIITEAEYEAQACLTAALSGGALRIFTRGKSSPLRRRWRGGKAWIRSRGVRDSYQEVTARLNRGPKDKDLGLWATIKQRGLGAWRLASRAGEFRHFEYDITTGKATLGDNAEPSWFNFDLQGNQQVTGKKTITYTFPGNPLRQLMELEITEFPAMVAQTKNPVFVLDQRFLAAKGQPLFRIVDQEHHFAALQDVASLVLQSFRLTLNTHLWTFRSPDARNPRTPQRLCGKLPGYAAPEISELAVEPAALAEQPVTARLAHYRPVTPNGELPIVMFHGYSASSTSFAHPDIHPHITGYLLDHGYDVWLVDFRSSCGMPMATHPWDFEDVALKDIPVSIDHICKAANVEQVHVIAHCMGTAMFGMAILAGDREADILLEGRETPFEDHFKDLRDNLSDRIASCVLSQVAPLPVFSPANILRAWGVRYVQYLLNQFDYHFRPSENPALTEQLLDRLLAAVPYPDDEILRENPWPKFWKRSRYVATRHRMDVMYGRDFSLKNCNDTVLDKLDDFFGPMNLDTLAQTIHFARGSVITNPNGRNAYVNLRRLEELWTFPTFSINGKENGLADKATPYRMKKIFSDAGVADRYDFKVYDRFGHQDILIGDGADDVYADVAEFISRSSQRVMRSPGQSVTNYQLLASPPATGPSLVPTEFDEPDYPWYVSSGCAAQLGTPDYCVLVAVKHCDDNPGHLCVADGSAYDKRIFAIPPDSFTIHAPHDLTRLWMSPVLASNLIDKASSGILVLHITSQSGALLDAVIKEAPPGVDLFDPINLFNDDIYANLDDASGEKAAIDDLRARYKAIEAAIIQRLAENNEKKLSRAIIEPPVTKRFASPDLPDAKQPEQVLIALGSCQYPSGMLDRDPAYASWAKLAELLDDANQTTPDALVLLGDQVYVDATAGLFDPPQLDDRYRLPYEHWLKQSKVQQVIRRLPLHTTLDDHEIDDNWEPNSLAGDESEQQRRLGRKAFLEYQRGIEEPLSSSPLSQQFEYGKVRFFQMDSRNERGPRHARNFTEASLVDEAQLDSLMAWLDDAPHDCLNVITSPSIVLPRHRNVVDESIDNNQLDSPSCIQSDSWDGYPGQLTALLEKLSTLGDKPVVLLSGDEHLGGIARITLTDSASNTAKDIWSIHCAGLYTPMPFANAKPSDLIHRDCFKVNTSLDCEVENQPFDGSGFSMVKFEQQAGKWRVGHCLLEAHGSQAEDLDFEWYPAT